MAAMCQERSAHLLKVTLERRSIGIYYHELATTLAFFPIRSAAEIGRDWKHISHRDHSQGDGASTGTLQLVEDVLGIAAGTVNQKPKPSENHRN